MKSRLPDLSYGLLALAGIVLMTWAAFHLGVAREVQACSQQDCSSSWTALSDSCDDLFRCGCGTNCTATENTCYRERGYCNGSSPSNNIIFRKCYLGLCPCLVPGQGADGGCKRGQAGYCLGIQDFVGFPSSGCITGLTFSSYCTRSNAFRSKCEDYNEEDCNCLGGGFMSPIVVDVDGNGFSLSSAPSGVVFNMLNDGVPLQLAWTAKGSTNAFFVLDRNGNGTIDIGAELFGDLTPQPTVDSPNGFLALAEYDKSGSGGNGDGGITASDAIFSQLKLWQDFNHNGVSEPSELKALAGVIQGIDLNYKESKRTDTNGNQFRYRAKVYGPGGQQSGRWAWDVFLKVQ